MKTNHLVGPLPSKNHQNGGARISFQEYCDFFNKSSDYKVLVYDTGSLGFAKLRIILLALRLLMNLRSGHILFLNLSAPRYWMFVISIFPVFFYPNLDLRIRFFGGDFRSLYTSSKVYRTVSNRLLPLFNKIYIQIKADADFFSSRWRVYHLPTTRQFLPKKNVTKLQKVIAINDVKKPYTVAIVEFLANHYPDVKFTIVGNKVARKSKNVKYLPFLSRPKMLEEMSTAKVVLFPTIWKGEGVPGTIIEALICGNYVIASAKPGILECINSSTGKTVETLDPKDWLKAFSTFNFENASFKTKSDPSKNLLTYEVLGAYF